MIPPLQRSNFSLIAIFVDNGVAQSINRRECLAASSATHHCSVQSAFMSVTRSSVCDELCDEITESYNELVQASAASPHTVQSLELLDLEISQGDELKLAFVKTNRNVNTHDRVYMSACSQLSSANIHWPCLATDTAIADSESCTYSTAP